MFGSMLSNVMGGNALVPVVEETCSCGAKVKASGVGATTAAAEWRQGHRCLPKPAANRNQNEPSAEPAPEKPDVPTPDYPLGHPHMGNVCGGFGGDTECEYPTEAGPCRKSPGEHQRSYYNLFPNLAPDRGEHVSGKRAE